MAQIPKTVLVTGANRGIGLEFVNQLLKLNLDKIIATARDPTKAEALQKLAQEHPNKLHIVQLEVTNYESFPSFVESVKKSLGTNVGLNWLINNAGIYLKATLEEHRPADLIRNYEVNAVAPLFLTRVLLPILRQSSATGERTLVTNISSRMGSIDDNTTGSHYAYRASKTALNSIVRSLATDLKPDQIQVVSIHPGWVQTDMGGVGALITPEESVSKMLSVMQNTENDLSGKFFNYDGQPINW